MVTSPSYPVEAPQNAGLNLVTLSRSERREQPGIQSKPKPGQESSLPDLNSLYKQSVSI